MATDKIRRPLTAVLGSSAAGLLVLMVACIVWQVVSRYGLGTPSTVTDEIARFAFMWSAMLGAVYAAGNHKHLAMTILVSRLGGRASAAAVILVHGLIVVFAVSLLWGGASLVERSLRLTQVSPSLGWPMGYVYIALPLSGALILLYGVLDIIDTVTGRAPRHFASDL